MWLKLPKPWPNGRNGVTALVDRWIPVHLCPHRKGWSRCDSGRDVMPVDRNAIRCPETRVKRCMLANLVRATTLRQGKLRLRAGVAVVRSLDPSSRSSSRVTRGRRGIHDIPIQHDEVRLLPLLERPDGVFGVHGVRGVEGHALERLCAREGLIGVPVRRHAGAKTQEPISKGASSD